MNSSDKKIIAVSPAGMKMDHLFLTSFHVAGFSYYQGSFLFSELKIGSRIELVPDTNNIHDEYAVEVRFNGNKIGYVPRSDNCEISTILKAGHNIFIGVIQQISPIEHPEQQVRIGVFVTRNTETTQASPDAL